MEAKEINHNMRWIGVIFAILIPLSCFISVAGLGLSGGLKMPLDWMCTFAITLTFSFVFSLINLQSRLTTKSKILLEIIVEILLLNIGLFVGFLFFHFGNFVDPSRDSSYGAFSIQDVTVLAVWGDFSGLGLSVGTLGWTQVFAEWGLNRSTSLTLAVITGFLIVGLSLKLLFL